MKDVYFNALSDNLITLRFTRYKHVQTVCYTIEFGNQIRLSLLEALARLKRTSHEQPRL